LPLALFLQGPIKPTATAVTVVDDIVHTGVVCDANATLSPDDAVALTVKGAAPNDLPVSAPKVMVWAVNAHADKEIRQRKTMALSRPRNDREGRQRKARRANPS